MQDSSKPRKISPYFSFCKLHREKVKARLKNAGQPTTAAALSKALGDLWRSLTAIEKQKYNQQPTDTAPDAIDLTEAPLPDQNGNGHSEDTAGQGKQSVPKDDASLAERNNSKESGPAITSPGDRKDEEHDGNKQCSADGALEQPEARLAEEHVLAFPLTRLKRIIKLDKDIRVVSADASILVAHATQLFLEHLAGTAYAAALQKKHKTIRLEDLKNGIKAERRVEEFLGDALNDLFSTEKEDAEDDSESDNDEEETENGEQSAIARHNDLSTKRKAAKKSIPAPPVGTRCIMEFFGNKTTHAEASGSGAA